MIYVGSTQAAWVEDRIGPGLFVQMIGGAILTIAVAMAAISVRLRPHPGRLEETASEAAGPFVGRRSTTWLARELTPQLALLGAVLAFALVAPIAGLVLATAMAGGLAGFAAGPRTVWEISHAACLATAMSTTIGLTILPEAIQLWPNWPASGDLG
ncbi:MAG: hypothetical protein ACRC14_01660 [Paracoccaceae bacterium]